MKIWKLLSDVNNYASLTLTKGDIIECLDFDGSRRKDTWNPLAVSFIDDSYLPLSDKPELASGVPVFSQKAVEILKDLIFQDVEILDLRCRKGKYYAINVTELLNCIDYNNSIYKKFSGSDRIMRFIKYSFISKQIENKHIFKIYDEPKRDPFVSDEFKNLVGANGMIGFKFELVWDSEIDI